MSRQIVCECGKRYAIRPGLEGKLVKCGACGETMRVPKPVAALPVDEPAFSDQPTSSDRPADIVACGDIYDIAPSEPEEEARPSYSPATSPQRGPGKRRRPMPESARNACLGLITGGFLWTIFTGMGIYLMSTDKIDALGRAAIWYFATAAAGGYLGAVLVWQRVPVVTFPLVILVTIPYLLFCPLGTIVGLIILKYLFDPETREYLA